MANVELVTKASKLFGLGAWVIVRDEPFMKPKLPEDVVLCFSNSFSCLAGKGVVGEKTRIAVDCNQGSLALEL